MKDSIKDIYTMAKLNEYGVPYVEEDKEYDAIQKQLEEIDVANQEIDPMFYAELMKQMENTK